MQIELSHTAQIDTVVIVTSFFRLRPVPKYRFERFFQKNTRLLSESGKRVEKVFSTRIRSKQALIECAKSKAHVLGF